METRVREVQEVDITPMIDIVFQLIIFFMVVMAIAAVYGVAIKFPPPGSPENQSKSEDEKRIVVTVKADWIAKGHAIRRDGILKINGEEIPLAHSKDREKWAQEREKGYRYLREQMRHFIEEEGYKKDMIIIKGDVKTYQEKIMKVIDQAKEVGIDGFSLVPPVR
jgi:biopolymer transport protein ExbD